MAFSLPVGNPGEACFYDASLFCLSSYLPCDFISLRAGFYGDYVFNRHLEIDKSDNHSDIESSKLFTNGGTLLVNIAQFIDLYTVLSSSHFYLKTPGRSFTAGFTPFIEIETESDFSWGVGGRISYCLCQIGTFGLQGEYFQANLPISYVRRENTNPAYVNNLDFHYHEWQISLAYTKIFYSDNCALAFAPYLAIQWAGVDVDMNNANVRQAFNFNLPDLRNQRTTGFTVGMSFLFYQKSAVSVEGRFASELALSVQGQIRF